MRHNEQGCLPVAGQQRVAVLGDAGGLETLDEAGQRDHVTAPQPMVKRAISASMRASACSRVSVVRWV
jgi:hypothetical protein